MTVRKIVKYFIKSMRLKSQMIITENPKTNKIEQALERTGTKADNKEWDAVRRR